MPARALNIENAVSRLEPGDHVCLLFSNPRRWHDFMVSFLAEGVARRERCVYVTSLYDPARLKRMLAGSHAGLGQALASGQLLVLHYSRVYTPQGVFEPEETLRSLTDAVETALALGYLGLRVTGEMHWASYRPPGYARLAQYEAMLNPLFEHLACLAVCQYDRALFAPSLLDQIAGAHSWVVEA